MPAPLERIYDDHAQALFAFLLNFTRSEADTKDVLQELFRKLATQSAPLRDIRDERAYLLKLAHNLAVDFMRRRFTRAKNHEAFANEPVALFAETLQPDAASFREALAAALATLPPEQRAVAHLKLWEGATFEEIAATLNIPANTAASRYRYAIDKLRERLRPIYGEIK